MKNRDLSELLSLLPEQSQRNLVLAAAFFLRKVRKVNHFSGKDIKQELVGRFTGASKINVGAVFLNQCTGLVEPLTENAGDGLKQWRLTSTGVDYVSRLFITADNADPVKPNKPFGLAFDNLHPVIREASTKLFQDGHLSGAIEAALKAVNKHLRRKTGRTADGGVPMMHKIFNPTEFKGNKDCLRLNALMTQSDKDEQEGYRFLYAGAQQGIRNPFDHDGRSVRSRAEAFEYLAFASHLARVADRAEPA